MEGKLVAAVIAVGIIGYLLLRAHRFIVTTWILVRVWRFLTGEAHHGRPITDRGWFRPGVKALTPTGHATRWRHLPRIHATAHRTGGVLLVVALLVGWQINKLLTVIIVLSVFGVVLAIALWLLVRLFRGRGDRNTWLIPGHKSLHELANWPKAKRAASWITLQTERTEHGGDRGTAVVKATLKLPDGWPPDAKDRERFVARAATQFGIESPDTTGSRWAGQSPVLILARSEPPPALVRWEQVAGDIAKAHSNELVTGLGKKDVLVTASLSSDSPHFGINMGTGGGKSSLAAFWLVQLLMRGAICMVLDSKYHSHPWLIKDEHGEHDQLPNVAYLSTAEELHAGMMWLGEELKRRNKVTRRAITASGEMRANVGPRIIIVAEELNQAIPHLKQHWADVRTSDDVKASPALSAFREVAFAGRAVKMHLILIGQMLTAEVTGGGKDSAVRENVGVKALARYGTAGWRSVVGGDVPMPPVPSVLGRIQLVTASGVRECQVPKPDLLLYRELATSGDVSLCPAFMPGAVTVSDAAALHSGPDQSFVTVSPPRPAAAGGHHVTLREARDMGIVHRRTTLDSLKMARFRDEDFPESVGLRGTAKVYDAAALAAWDQARRN